MDLDNYFENIQKVYSYIFLYSISNQFDLGKALLQAERKVIEYNKKKARCKNLFISGFEGILFLEELLKLLGIKENPDISSDNYDRELRSLFEHLLKKKVIEFSVIDDKKITSGFETEIVFDDNNIYTIRLIQNINDEEKYSYAVKIFFKTDDDNQNITKYFFNPVIINLDNNKQLSSLSQRIFEELNGIFEQGSFDELTDTQENKELTQVKRKPTTIKILTNGNRCPSCGAPEMKAQSGEVYVINKSGEEDTIIAKSCSCGCIYLTGEMKERINRLKEKYDIEYVQVKDTLNKRKKTQKKKAKKQDSFYRVSYGMISCRKCRSKDVYNDTGLCYTCYKEEQARTFGLL